MDYYQDVTLRNINQPQSKRSNTFLSNKTIVFFDRLMKCSQISATELFQKLAERTNKNYNHYR